MDGEQLRHLSGQSLRPREGSHKDTHGAFLQAGRQVAQADSSETLSVPCFALFFDISIPCLGQKPQVWCIREEQAHQRGVILKDVKHLDN